MTKKRAVLRSQGCLIAVLGLVLALAGPIVDRSWSALGFSALLGSALAFAGGALYFWAPERRSIVDSRSASVTRRESWPTSAEPLVTICLPTSDAEQAFVESLLRGQGISFVTQNPNAHLAVGEYAGPPEIQVSAADVSRARQVMAAPTEEPPENERGGDAS